jgi:Family of unknown function (DUF5681)
MANDGHLWTKGETGNPNGRPKGSRNKRTQEILDLIQARGDKDPLDALSDIVTKNQDPAIVAQASNILAPYLHSKRSTTPAPRFFPEAISVPTFTSIEQAEDYLAQLPVLLGNCSLDSQSALELSTLVRNWIEAKLAHTGMDIKVTASGGSGDQRIVITGGLPVLPGCQAMILPKLNGHEINGEALPAPSPAEQTQTESVQSVPQEAPDGDPWAVK